MSEVIHVCELGMQKPLEMYQVNQPLGLYSSMYLPVPVVKYAAQLRPFCMTAMV